MIRFAWDGIISFSDKPLRAALNLGFLAIAVSFGVLATASTSTGRATRCAGGPRPW